MVVQVVVPGVERPARAPAVTHECVDDLTHRQDDAAQRDEILADRVRRADELAAGAPLREQRLLEAFESVVERLDCVEMAVDDVVEQPVHERAAALRHE